MNYVLQKASLALFIAISSTPRAGAGEIIITPKSDADIISCAWDVTAEYGKTGKSSETGEKYYTWLTALGTCNISDGTQEKFAYTPEHTITPEGYTFAGHIKGIHPNSDVTFHFENSTLKIVSSKVSAGKHFKGYHYITFTPSETSLSARGNSAQKKNGQLEPVTYDGEYACQKQQHYSNIQFTYTNQGVLSIYCGM